MYHKISYVTCPMAMHHLSFSHRFLEVKFTCSQTIKQCNRSFSQRHACVAAIQLHCTYEKNLAENASNKYLRTYSCLNILQSTQLKYFRFICFKQIFKYRKCLIGDLFCMYDLLYAVNNFALQKIIRIIKYLKKCIK